MGNSRERAQGGSDWTRQTAQNGSETFHARADEAHRRFASSAEQSSANFRDSNRSQLGSGQSSVQESSPGAASTDLLAMTTIALASALGAAAAARILGNRRHV